MRRYFLGLLPHLTQLANELAALEGNVGRKVRRFFEECFPRDELTLEAEFPDMGPTPDPSRRAAFLAHAQSLVDEVNHGIEGDLLKVSLDVSHLPETPTFADAYRLRVSIEHGLPESLKERQHLLRKLDSLQRLTGLLEAEAPLAA